MHPLKEPDCNSYTHLYNKHRCHGTCTVSGTGTYIWKSSCLCEVVTGWRTVYLTRSLNATVPVHATRTISLLAVMSTAATFFPFLEQDCELKGYASLVEVGAVADDTTLMRASGLVFAHAGHAGISLKGASSRYFVLDMNFDRWEPDLYVTVSISGTELNLISVQGGVLASDAAADDNEEDWKPTGLNSMHDSKVLDGVDIFSLEGGRQLDDAATESHELVQKIRLTAKSEDSTSPTKLRLAGCGVIDAVQSVTCSRSAFSPPSPSPPPPSPATLDVDDTWLSAAVSVDTSESSGGKDLKAKTAPAHTPGPAWPVLGGDDGTQGEIQLALLGVLVLTVVWAWVGFSRAACCCWGASAERQRRGGYRRTSTSGKRAAGKDRSKDAGGKSGCKSARGTSRAKVSPSHVATKAPPRDGARRASDGKGSTPSTSACVHGHDGAHGRASTGGALVGGLVGSVQTKADLDVTYC